MVRFVTALAGLFALVAVPAVAQPLILGTTPNPAPAAVFVADDQGLFEAHGVDVEVQIIATDATIPAALVSGSIALGSVTPTTLLSAVSNGIDLVVLSGTTVTTTESKDVAILAGTNSGIATVADFAGKTSPCPAWVPCWMSCCAAGSTRMASPPRACGSWNPAAPAPRSTQGRAD